MVLVRSLALLLLLLGLIPQQIFAVQNDPFFSEQWYLKKIQAPDVPVSTERTPVIVAVLDSGIDLRHPDLVHQLFQHTEEVVGDEQDNDGNGFIDDRFGWDFVDNDADPEPGFPHPSAREDAIIHGTLVASLIAAEVNNNEGIAGAAPRVQILALRVADHQGKGSTTDAARAIRYAVASGARVINVSFASDAKDPDLIAALLEAYKAGVVVVAAVGNSAAGGRDLAALPVFPACAQEGNLDLVIGVGATDKSDQKASFSNFNSSCVDISAPGTDIFGAAFARSGTAFTVPYKGYWSGTSFAAPLVSAAAANLVSAHPELSPEQVKQIVQLAVDPLPSGLFSTVLGAGRLNIARALEIAPLFAQRSASPSVSPIVSSAPPTPVWSIDDDQGFAWFTSDADRWNSLTAYVPRLPGGVFATAADTDHNGTNEIVTIPRTENGGPQVRIWSSTGVLVDQFFLGDEKERGGWRLAHGTHPVHGDVYIRFHTAPQHTDVSIYRATDRVLVERFTLDMRVGSVVMSRNGREIIVGAAPGSAPHVMRLSLSGDVQARFLAYDERFLGGVNLTALNTKIVTVPGAGGGPHMRLFSYDGVPERDLFVADKQEIRGLSVQTVSIAGESFIAVRVGKERTQTLFSSTFEPVSFLHPSF